ERKKLETLSLFSCWVKEKNMFFFRHLPLSPSKQCALVATMFGATQNAVQPPAPSILRRPRFSFALEKAGGIVLNRSSLPIMRDCAGDTPPLVIIAKEKSASSPFANIMKV
ncbi:MAG: hypothetical protein AAGI06_17375, partial [Pseudomonadota bacterium]